MLSRPSNCREPSERGDAGNESVIKALSPDVVADDARTSGKVASTNAAPAVESGSPGLPSALINRGKTETAMAQSWTFAIETLPLPLARGSVKVDVSTVSVAAASASPRITSKPAGGGTGKEGGASGSKDAAIGGPTSEATRLKAAGDGETEAFVVSEGEIVGAAVGDALKEGVAVVDFEAEGEALFELLIEPLKVAEHVTERLDESDPLAVDEKLGDTDVEALPEAKEVGDAVAVAA